MTIANITVTHQFSGLIDYWGGNRRRWDDDAGCLFAYYGAGTTLKDCVDQWVDDSFTSGDCDSFSDNITDSDLRSAILLALTDQGRADYESGAIAYCAIEYASVNDIDENDEDYEDNGELPVWVILVEVV